MTRVVLKVQGTSVQGPGVWGLKRLMVQGLGFPGFGPAVEACGQGFRFHEMFFGFL